MRVESYCYQLFYVYRNAGLLEKFSLYCVYRRFTKFDVAAGDYEFSRSCAVGVPCKEHFAVFYGDSRNRLGVVGVSVLH